MTTSNFKRAEVVATTSRTALYGPVATGTTAIVFSGTFSNIDATNGADHTLTLEVFTNASVYVPRLFRVPIPYGGSSKCPKIVLLPGESLVVTSDVNSVIQASIDVLERI
jgi:hypothetical protein